MCAPSRKMERFCFCGSDVAKALGYSNPRKALSDHCKGVTKRYTPTSDGEQEMSFIPEGDVYRLIASSKLPSAEKFEKWVFDDVLPSIRKHGAYLTPDAAVKMMADPDFMYTLAKRFIEQKDRADQLAAELDVAKPKVEYFDALVDRNCLTNFRDTAKELGVEPRAFTEWLIANHFVYRDEKGQLRPYSEDRTDGYFELKECKSQRNGWSGVQTLVTPKGREAFRLMLSACESQLVS